MLLSPRQYDFYGGFFGVRNGLLVARHKRSALKESMCAGHVAVVQLLLEASADKNIRDKQGMTAVNLTRNSECKTLLL